MTDAYPPGLRSRLLDADRRYIQAQKKADDVLEELRSAVREADLAITAYRAGRGPDPGWPSFAEVVKDLAQRGQSGWSRTQLERWARGITTGRKSRARSDGGHGEPPGA